MVSNIFQHFGLKGKRGNMICANTQKIYSYTAINWNYKLSSYVLILFILWIYVWYDGTAAKWYTEFSSFETFIVMRYDIVSEKKTRGVLIDTNDDNSTDIVHSF